MDFERHKKTGFWILGRTVWCSQIYSSTKMALSSATRRPNTRAIGLTASRLQTAEPKSTKPLAWGCLNGVTNSSKKHCQFCFSWPSLHLFATVGVSFWWAYRGCCVPPQLHGQGDTYRMCDVAHTDSSIQHTRYMMCRQRKARSTEECLIV